MHGSGYSVEGDLDESLLRGLASLTLPKLEDLLFGMYHLALSYSEQGPLQRFWCRGRSTFCACGVGMRSNDSGAVDLQISIGVVSPSVHAKPNHLLLALGTTKMVSFAQLERI